MIQSILVPIDGSPAADSALENAIELARIASAELRGLFVEDASMYMVPAYAAPMPEAFMPGLGTEVLLPMPSGDMIREWELTGQRLRVAFDRRLAQAGVHGSFAVVRGIARDVIIEHARTVDLVAIGRRGRPAIERSKTPGSHTEALLMTTTRPVLVVPEGGRRTGRILIAYDGSKAARRALDFGATFAEMETSKVDLLSVAHREEEAHGSLEEARQFLAPYHLDVSFVAKPGHPAPVISQHAREINAGLIVMGAYGHGRLVEMIFGSTTRDILASATCPVLLAS